MLESDKWSGWFRHVAFAVFDDHNARGAGNYEPFRRMFASLTNVRAGRMEQDACNTDVHGHAAHGMPNRYNVENGSVKNQTATQWIQRHTIPESMQRGR